MISLLEDYVQHLRNLERETRTSSSNGPLNYYMASDSVSPEEWADFDNVYQVHSPRIYLDNIVRDVSHSRPSPLTTRADDFMAQIMLQYYNCSRSRRGFEYHMATRYILPQHFVSAQILTSFSGPSSLFVIKRKQ